MQELFTAIPIIAISIAFVIAHLRMAALLDKSLQILASKNYTEYSVGQARMVKANSGQKPEPSYDGAWEEEQDNG